MVERRLIMPSTSTIHKAKLTVTISGDVVNEIDEIAKEKGTPRSQVTYKRSFCRQDK